MYSSVPDVASVKVHFQFLQELCIKNLAGWTSASEFSLAWLRKLPSLDVWMVSVLP